MADTATAEPDLSSLIDSPPGRRKRSAPDSPIEPRRTKRGVPTTVEIDGPDPATAFMESALETAQAAAAGVNVSDFNALQQAAAGEHSDAADPANASSTAAAALVYPTIHIPQTTEETFAAQVGLELEQQQHHPEGGYAPDVSHSDGLPMDGLPSHPAMQTTNGMHHEQRYSSSTPNPKPAVGSEEWHKMRKDNHKEGKHQLRQIPIPLDLVLTHYSRAPTPRDYQRGHQ